jgi:glycosyltransferase 2 family protein
LVALAYRQVMQAFPPSAGELSSYGLPEAILLMSASVAGGIIQLPIVGGGAQLATIALLSNSFDHYNEHPEIAVAAGLMFWLVTFISVTPLGLILARFEHLSIRKISQEAEIAEEQDPNGNGK